MSKTYVSNDPNVLVKVESKIKPCVVCGRNFKTKVYTRGDGKTFDGDQNLGACHRAGCIRTRMIETL